MSEPSWVPLGATGLNPPAPATPADDGKWLQAQGGAMLWQTLPASGIQATIVDAKGDLIAATAADAVARLAAGSNGQVLTAQSAQATGLQWATLAASTPSLVTALPGSPTDGQECVLTDSLTAPTYSWHLKYVAAKASNKWLFVGGAARIAEVLASESTTSTSYIALTTAGPSIAVPVAGDYLVDIGFSPNGGGTDNSSVMSYDIGGTAASDNDAVSSGPPGGGGAHQLTSVSRRRRQSLSAVTLTAKYKVAGGSGFNFRWRWMSLIPIAVGG